MILAQRKVVIMIQFPRTIFGIYIFCFVAITISGCRTISGDSLSMDQADAGSRPVAFEWLNRSRSSLTAASAEAESLKLIGQRIVYDPQSTGPTEGDSQEFVTVGRRIHRILVQVEGFIEDELVGPGENQMIPIEDFNNQQGEAVSGLHSFNTGLINALDHFEAKVIGGLSILQRAAGFTAFNEKYAAALNFESQVNELKSQVDSLNEILGDWLTMRSRDPVGIGIWPIWEGV
jgi:hypothetical protein